MAGEPRKKAEEQLETEKERRVGGNRKRTRNLGGETGERGREAGLLHNERAVR